MTDSLTLEQTERLNRQGWVLVPDVIEAGLLDALSAELDRSLQRRQEIRARNGVDGSNDGTLHHLLADHPSYLQLLARLERFDGTFKAYFAGNYILNSYGGVVNRRDATAYVHQVHRDIRFSSDTKRFMLNVLVMLDDFTLRNGATHLLSGSQTQPDKPDHQAFLRQSDRALGSRGTLLLFDSRLWHATGQNNDDGLRRALTITFTSPFFKQQLDYPRLLGYDKLDTLGSFLRQVIGYNARVPASLDEYYVPAAKRFYQRGQDD